MEYDGDGSLDVSVALGGWSLQLAALYHNEGSGTFRKVTTNTIAKTRMQAFVHVWADYDNDGRVDLFVPNLNNMNDILFHNRCSFTRITTGHPVVDGATSVVGV